MRRLAALTALLALAAPAHASTTVSCGGTAPRDLDCSVSLLPECTTVSCQVHLNVQPGTFFTGVIQTAVDGSLSRQHYGKTCYVVLGLGLGGCGLTASLTSFDTAFCSAQVAGAGRWAIRCDTP